MPRRKKRYWYRGYGEFVVPKEKRAQYLRHAWHDVRTGKANKEPVGNCWVGPKLARWLLRKELIVV